MVRGVFHGKPSTRWDIPQKSEQPWGRCNRQHKLTRTLTQTLNNATASTNTLSCTSEGPWDRIPHQDGKHRCTPWQLLSPCFHTETHRTSSLKALFPASKNGSMANQGSLKTNHVTCTMSRNRPLPLHECTSSHLLCAGWHWMILLWIGQIETSDWMYLWEMKQNWMWGLSH